MAAIKNLVHTGFFLFLLAECVVASAAVCICALWSQFFGTALEAEFLLRLFGSVIFCVLVAFFLQKFGAVDEIKISDRLMTTLSLAALGLAVLTFFSIGGMVFGEEKKVDFGFFVFGFSSLLAALLLIRQCDSFEDWLVNVQKKFRPRSE